MYPASAQSLTQHIADKHCRSVLNIVCPRMEQGVESERRTPVKIQPGIAPRYRPGNAEVGQVTFLERVDSDAYRYFRQ